MGHTCEEGTPLPSHIPSHWRFGGCLRCDLDTPAFFLCLGSYWCSFPTERCVCVHAGGSAAAYRSPVIEQSPLAWTDRLIALPCSFISRCADCCLGYYSPCDPHSFEIMTSSFLPLWSSLPIIKEIIGRGNLSLISMWLLNESRGHASDGAKSLHFLKYALRVTWKNILLLYVHRCFACMRVCVSQICLVSEEVRREHWIPWNWSYGWLFDILWVLGIKSGSSEEHRVLLNTEPFL